MVFINVSGNFVLLWWSFKKVDLFLIGGGGVIDFLIAWKGTEVSTNHYNSKI